MEEILHQLIGSLSHLQGFIHPRWVVWDFFHQPYHGLLKLDTVLKFVMELQGLLYETNDGPTSHTSRHHQQLTLG